MAQMITEDLVRLDADLGSDKHDVIRALAGIVDDAGRATDAHQLAEDALAREATAATGLNGGIAIPHCRSAGVETPTLAFARLSPSVEFGAKDGPADLAFLIAAPAGGDASHLKLLAKLARALVKKEFTDSLRAATTPAQVVAAGQRRRRRRAAGSRAALRRHRAAAPAPEAARRSCRVERPSFAGRGDRVPHRHRAHLHGRGGAAAGGRPGRHRDQRRDAGLGRGDAAARRSHPQRRRGDLRVRRGRPRPAPLRWTADGQLGREARGRRPRRDDRRRRRRDRQPQRSAGRGLR